MNKPAPKASPSNGTKAPGPPVLTLPKGGGAVRGIGEKFSANPVTGTSSFTVPISVSPGRAGFGPALSLAYDSGAGNGPFGLGWSLSLPAITRKTDKGLPQYRDTEESDVFILSGAEDLVPAFKKDQNSNWMPDGKGGCCWMKTARSTKATSSGVIVRVSRGCSRASSAGRMPAQEKSIGA